MKTIITLILTAVLVTANGQSVDYHVLLDSAKKLFKGEKELTQQELDEFDYSKIVLLLSKVVEVNPNSSEARYFLGYAYSRLNSRDGRSMIDADVELVLKASEQFEKVNTLTPKYTGEIVILDPYSKLTAEWGSLAMRYWYHNKLDSAIWAFKEGRKRGGFGEFILELNKKVLDSCKPNSILVSSGDNLTIPLWFLQIAEGYRKDVAVIDIALLNTNWYPSQVAQKNLVAFDLPNQVLDTINYTTWRDSIITIGDFAWTLKPSYYEEYLLRGDRILLSLLKQNKFEKDLYFTFGFNEDSRLSLKNYLSSFIIVDQLTPNEVLTPEYTDYKKSMIKFLQMSHLVNRNSSDELGLYDYFRFNLLEHVGGFLSHNEKKKAKELMEILDRYADDKKFPYQDNMLKEYAEQVRLSL